jgi:23S rRNA (adenine2030-N6)-methyltransferase
MLLLNPPWQLDERVKALLPILHRVLSPTGAGAQAVEWLVPE